jgi:hypothetical protein
MLKRIGLACLLVAIGCGCLVSAAGAQTDKFQQKFSGDVAFVQSLSPIDPVTSHDLFVQAVCQNGIVYQPGGKPQPVEVGFIYVDSIIVDPETGEFLDFCAAQVEVDCTHEALESASWSAENVTLFSFFTGEPCFTLDSIEIDITGVGDVERQRSQSKFDAPGIKIHSKTDLSVRQADVDISVVENGVPFPISGADSFAQLLSVKDAVMQIFKP